MFIWPSVTAGADSEEKSCSFHYGSLDITFIVIVLSNSAVHDARSSSDFGGSCSSMATTCCGVAIVYQVLRENNTKVHQAHNRTATMTPIPFTSVNTGIM